MNENVSIIVPYYNLGKYLEEAIISCLDQTYRNIEIIVINDGSTEEYSTAIFEELKNKYKDVKFISQKNQGLVATRNNGIKIAKGKYICCLDADDKIEPTYIEKIVSNFNENDSTGFVTTYAQFFGDQDTVWKTSSNEPLRLLTENIIHVSSVFKKSIWEEVNGYSDYMDTGYEDWEFWIKIVSKGYGWSLIAEPLFLHRIRENSMISTSDKARPDLLKKIVINNKNLFIKNIQDLVLYYDKKILEKINETETFHKTTISLTNRLFKERKLNQDLKIKLYREKKNELKETECLNNQILEMTQKINEYQSSKYYKILIIKFNLLNKIKTLFRKFK